MDFIKGFFILISWFLGVLYGSMSFPPFVIFMYSDNPSHAQFFYLGALVWIIGFLVGFFNMCVEMGRGY